MEFIVFAIISIAVFLIAHVSKGNGARWTDNAVDQHGDQMRQLREESDRSIRLREERRSREARAEPELVDEEMATRRRVAEKIDQIASKPNGLMLFDTNSDGIVDDEEMEAGRKLLAEEFLGTQSEDGELKPFTLESLEEESDISIEEKITW